MVISAKKYPPKYDAGRFDTNRWAVIINWCSTNGDLKEILRSSMRMLPLFETSFCAVNSFWRPTTGDKHVYYFRFPSQRGGESTTPNFLHQISGDYKNIEARSLLFRHFMLDYLRCYTIFLFFACINNRCMYD